MLGTEVAEMSKTLSFAFEELKLKIVLLPHWSIVEFQSCSLFISDSISIEIRF